MINQRHDIAVQSMKKPTDTVTMVIERQNVISTLTTTPSHAT
uniref:Uncharacterized protein n=1 Tax=Panagrolaimus sp. ES5 TaxID=591445 RepID=A0AC34G7M6_9BILA